MKADLYDLIDHLSEEQQHYTLELLEALFFGIEKEAAK